MRKLSVILIFVALNIFTSLQQAVLAQEKSPGDTQFELGAYQLAIDSYLQELKLDPDNTAILEKLAEAYTQTNQSVRAARMYDQMLQSGKPVKDGNLIAYGHVLRSMGLFDQAKAIYEKCDDPEYMEKAQHFAKMAVTASKMMSQRDAYEVYLIRPSSKSDDFSPSFWNEALMFSSFTNDQAETNPLNIKRNKLNLIQSRTVKNLMISAEMKSGNIDWQGVNALHFSYDQSKAVFTRNNFRNGNKQIIGNEKNLSIYVADVDKNGVFSNEIALPVNNTNYSAAYACFGEDANTIYFSSNMHGDQSDFDLYVIKFEQNAWTAPAPLGSNINSPGNEISPYYVDGTIYFSSDFHPGLGGYDVFTSKNMDGIWALPENLGKGINSIGDDITLIYEPVKSEYYYASNRIGGKGGYDLYYSIPSQRISDEEILAQNLPKAVNLDDMTDLNAVNIKSSPSEQVGFRDNIMAPDDLSLEGAVKVAYGEIINTTMRVYFVQLASITQDKGNYDRYNSLIDLGNVYRIKKDNTFKIRLGYFYGEPEAKEVLSTVRNKGFKDAFLVEEMLNVKELELLVSKYSFQKNAKYEKPAVESSYKVRLAAYSNPLYFDVEKVKDLGMIEQWSKDKWTIFILSGFETIEQAKNSQIKAINRGFTGAELVLDSEGVLTRVNEN